MRSQLTALDKYYDRLTAKERAILSLKGWKNDDEPDEVLKRTTPQHDVRIVRSHLEAVARTAMVLGGMADGLAARLDGLQLRLAVVGALALRDLERQRLQWLLQFDLPEVLTESEAAAQIAERRAVLLTLKEAAWHLVDMELDDEELERDAERQERTVRAAVKAGELKAVRGKLRFGDLLDWNGETLAPWANDGLHVAVLPDSAKDYANQARAARVALRGLHAGDDRISGLAEAMLRSAAAHLVQAEETRLSLEAVASWVAEDFDGEDPLHPSFRDQLGAIAESIAALVEQLAESGSEVELPSLPDQELLGVLQRAIATR